MEILPRVLPDVEFAVSEECIAAGGCDVYNPLLAAGKPVFHIEYVTHNTSSSGAVTLKSALSGLANASTEEVREVDCLEKTLPGTDAERLVPAEFSTVIKGLLLDGWVYYCDKSYATTPEKDVGTGGPSSGYCGS